MERLREFLQRGRNGNAVLFCGAGLTADCLNFDDVNTVGVTSHLLHLLNDELRAKGKQSGFKDIRNAAKRFRLDLGNYRLMGLLRDRFKLRHVSASIVDIVSYPWASIYTTNYDNGLEFALQSSKKRFVSLNNLDDPKATASGTPVIHLHGFAEAWTHENFERSCVLDADSYLQLSGVSSWLKQLRFHIERAEVIVFIGFAAADFHLAQVFFDASGMREKAFFINRPSSNPDLDERATQEDFGEPLYIGRDEFASIVTEILRQKMPIEPQFASFLRYQPPRPSAFVPPVQDIEDLFIWGKIVPEHLKRDHDLSRSDYHVLRNEVQEIQMHFGEAGRIVLLNGDICDGKSMIISGAANGLAAGRPVFELRHAYDDLLNEASSILSVYPNAVLLVESCFSLRDDRLLGLARLISGSAGGMILSARNISTEAESGKLKGLRAIPSLVEIGIGRLQTTEIDSLIILIDQIAGWQDFRKFTQSERRRFVETECKGILPSVLLRLLNSEYVRGKYREEYNKTSYLDARDRQMVIAALLIANIGLDAPISFLSDIFEKDFDFVLKKIQKESGGLRLVRAEGGLVRTIPSIGARNILKNVVDMSDVVNTNIFILEKMAEGIRRSDFQRHVFSQLMRYSILSATVPDESEISRFFDHISKISHFREMPLFWLQWHMATCAQNNRWSKAEEYLKMGYNAADAFEKKRSEKYNRKQLDDRRAKFLAARADPMQRTGTELFNDMKEALEIVGRLMRDDELTHHPYETLLDVVRALQLRSEYISEGQKVILTRQLKGVADKAKSRLGVVPGGYQRAHATEWMNQIEANIAL